MYLKTLQSLFQIGILMVVGPLMFEGPEESFHDRVVVTVASVAHGAGDAHCLQDRRRDLDAQWQTYLEQLTDADLVDAVFKVSSLSGQRAATKRSDILLHICTHAQYTTAQLVNMLRQAGQTDLPDVMLISMARTETPSSDLVDA
ncbi:MAG: DinB family protein [Planctomycetaceae bacterium]